MSKRHFCDYTLASRLKTEGFNEPCDYTYYNNYRVRDEIIEKHPGLSDSGYDDLLKEYGGKYEREEVYGHYLEPLHSFSRNSFIDWDLGERCSCPDVHQAHEWIREKKKIYVVPTYNVRLKVWNYNTLHMKSGKMDVCYHVDFDSYEDALHDGILKVLEK